MRKPSKIEVYAGEIDKLLGDRMMSLTLPECKELLEEVEANVESRMDAIKDDLRRDQGETLGSEDGR